MVFVREHRLDKATKALNVARRAVIEAEQVLLEAQQTQEAYSKWRVAEEERLMQSVMRKPVKLGDITDIRLDIATMRERELDYIDQVRKAEGELDRAKEALEEARLAYKKATQDTEKLVEHRVTWQREQDLEQERLADLELEDFTSPRTDHDFEPSTQNARYELN
jgi:hypothetical protein